MKILEECKRFLCDSIEYPNGCESLNLKKNNFDLMQMIRKYHVLVQLVHALKYFAITIHEIIFLLMCRQEIIHLEIFDWYQIGIKLLSLTNIVKELLVMQNAGRIFYIKSYDTEA